MSAEPEDLLDRLLRDAAGSNAPAAVREAAADGGHPADELITQLGAGSLAADQAKSLRRHILFCDACAARMAARGGDVTEAALTAATGDPVERPGPGRLVVPLQIRRRFGLIVGFAALALITLAGYFVIRATENEGDPRESELTPTPVLLDLRSIGPDGEGRRGIVRVEESVVLDLTDHFGDRTQFLYVLLFDGRGVARLLEPASGPAMPQLLDGSLRLPVNSPGWNLGSGPGVAVGDDLVFIVIVSAERIGSLEGEIASRVTLPRLTEEIASLWPLGHESGVDDVVTRIRTLGLGGVIRAVAARVRP